MVVFIQGIWFKTAKIVNIQHLTNSPVNQLSLRHAYAT